MMLKKNEHDIKIEFNPEGVKRKEEDFSLYENPQPMKEENLEKYRTQKQTPEIKERLRRIVN